ncbi:hypothetical protein ACYPKM_03085 [Pseudomonas aeruginosa]
MRLVEESIVLYPRRYNKRGEERLHSVMGVTPEGIEVNVKLRLPERKAGEKRASSEFRPSIAEFARDDVKAKNFCLASPENGPSSREGVLLFTGCVLEDQGKTKIPSYCATRWAYVLAQHSESVAPVFGLGRVAMIANSTKINQIQEERLAIEKAKPQGWEALVEQKNRELVDPAHYSYFGQLYEVEREATFDLGDRAGLQTYVEGVFKEKTRNNTLMGVLIRLIEDGRTLDGWGNRELFPRWQRPKTPGGEDTYQSAEDVLRFFFRDIDAARVNRAGIQLQALPIRRYPSGPNFKNYYFGRDPEASTAKIREKFLVNTEPTLCRVAFTLNRREDSGDLFLAKYFTLTEPLCPVAEIGQHDESSLTAGLSDIDPATRVELGLSWPSAIHLPSWYVAKPSHGFLVEADTLDLYELEDEVDQDDAPSVVTPSAASEATESLANPVEEEHSLGDELATIDGDELIDPPEPMIPDETNTSASSDDEIPIDAFATLAEHEATHGAGSTLEITAPLVEAEADEEFSLGALINEDLSPEELALAEQEIRELEAAEIARASEPEAALPLVEAQEAPQEAQEDGLEGDGHPMEFIIIDDAAEGSQALPVQPTVCDLVEASRENESVSQTSGSSDPTDSEECLTEAAEVHIDEIAVPIAPAQSEKPAQQAGGLLDYLMQKGKL